MKVNIGPAVRKEMLSGGAGFNLVKIDIGVKDVIFSGGCTRDNLSFRV
jgi:hypothetical protein